MRYLKFISLVVTCASLFSCNDDADKSDQPIYVVSSNLYSFKPSENAITRSLDVPIHPYLTVRVGNELYVHSSPFENSPVPPYPRLPLSLHVINLQTFSVTTSKQFSPPKGEASAMAVSDKIYVYDSDYYKGGAFVSKFDIVNLEAEDSAFTHTPTYAQDMLVLEGKVFISLGREIKIFDATTFDEIKTIDISSPVFSSDYSKFTLDKDKNILIYNGGVRRLSPHDLSVKALRKHDINTWGPMIRPAYNANEEALYIAVEKEGNDGLHHIRRFDIVTQTEEDFLANPDDIQFYISFISYNAENQLVIIGGAVGASGLIKTFNTKGFLQKEYTLPSPAWIAY